MEFPEMECVKCGATMEKDTSLKSCLVRYDCPTDGCSLRFRVTQEKSQLAPRFYSYRMPSMPVRRKVVMQWGAKYRRYRAASKGAHQSLNKMVDRFQRVAEKEPLK